jgi:hypothetical protein
LPHHRWLGGMTSSSGLGLMSATLLGSGAGSLLAAQDS